MRVITVLTVAGLILSLQGCAGKGVPIGGLGRPEFVPQSPPDSVVETGIRQDPNTGGIILQWYRMPGVLGYDIFRSDTIDSKGNPMEFTLVLNVAQNSAVNDTSALDPSVGVGLRYFYYVSAYSSEAVHSLPSDTISYELINRPVAVYPGGKTPTVNANGLHFAWYDATGGGYTVIRVRSISVVPFVTIWVSRRFQIFHSYPSLSFNFDSTATQQLVYGDSYEWRVERFNVDASGRPYEGSTSVWETFTVK